MAARYWVAFPPSAAHPAEQPLALKMSDFGGGGVVALKYSMDGAIISACRGQSEEAKSCYKKETPWLVYRVTITDEEMGAWMPKA